MALYLFFAVAMANSIFILLETESSTSRRPPSASAREQSALAYTHYPSLPHLPVHLWKLQERSARTPISAFE
jgi:hypothetical protein